MVYILAPFKFQWLLLFGLLYSPAVGGKLVGEKGENWLYFAIYLTFLLHDEMYLISGNSIFKENEVESVLNKGR